MKKNKPFGELFYRSLKKNLEIMRNAIIILFFGILQANAIDSYSQKTRLSFNFSETELVSVLDRIEQESEFFFLYNEKLLDTDRKVSIVANHEHISAILDDLFSGTDVKYTIVDRKIILAPDYLTELIEPQQNLIGGTVTDENGDPLAGVNIQVEGTTIGAISDINGKYSISRPREDIVLVFSFIGYNIEKISASGRITVDIQMTPDIKALEEVVVIGYGTVKRSDLTGSVGSISKEVINSQVVENPLMALTGITSGIQVIQTSGAPGSSIGVRIRGSNSLLGGNEPLYVIDGFPITGNLDNINPNDIESMEVLKDASATAIYGSRGANGVVLITTKRGNEGETSVEYNSYWGFQKETKRIDVLNAKEFATLANIRAANDGKAPYFTAAEIASFGEGTDWQDEIFRTGTIQNHSLIVSGGNNKTKFNLSGNYFDNKGIILNSSSKRYQLKLDIIHKISDNWKVSMQNILSRTQKNNLVSDNTTRGEGVLSGAISNPPTLDPYLPDGSYADPLKYPFSPDVLVNPLLVVNEIKNQTTKNSDLLNLGIEGTFLKDFTIRSSIGIEYYDQRWDYYTTKLYSVNYDGNARIGYSDFTNLLNENTLTYYKEVGRHALTVLGGITAQKTIHQDLTAGSNGFLTDVMENYNLASGSAIVVPSSGYSDYSILSYLSRINYSLSNKYLLTVSIRADGSSRFGKNSKWGYFPSAAAAWKISEEEFWPASNVIDNLKIRGSWGNTGNTAVSPYQSLATLSSISVVFDDKTSSAFAPGAIKPNPDLKWETTEQIDFGIDIGLFSDRLTVALDYYSKKTTDLLANVPLTPSSGYSSITSNIGSIENKGFELSANYKLAKGTFNWDLGANISTNRNKVVELSQGADIFGATLGHPISLPVTIVREGHPMGVFYGYKEDGLTEDGLIKHEDFIPDGVHNALDRQIIGDPNPDFIFGINSTMSYKNFGLTFVITGVQGNDIFNFNASYVADGFAFGLNQIQDVLGNYWTAEDPNPNAKYPKISEKTRYEVSDRYIEDGSYIKIQNLELSYTINRPSSFPLNNSQIYIGGQNLLTLTKYSWYSPEVNTRGAGISKGIDATGYPMARTLLVGVRIKL